MKKITVVVASNRACKTLHQVCGSHQVQSQMTDEAADGFNEYHLFGSQENLDKVRHEMKHHFSSVK